MKKTVLSFGEVLWDILPDQRVLGGAPFNFAHRIQSLGNTGLMVSRLGQDDFGSEALKKISNLGLSIDFIQSDKTNPTGTVNVFYDSNHQPDYEILPNVAYDFIELDPELKDAVQAVDCLCFGSLIQRGKVSRNTLEQLLLNTNALKFYDINLRKNCYNEEIIRYSLSQADILKLNLDEAKILSTLLKVQSNTLPEFVKDILEKYHIKYCVVTIDEYGALAISENETLYDAGHKIPFKDAIGAGDAFSAGFIHTLLQDKSLKEAVAFGNVLGALVATQVGGTEHLSLEQIKTFQENGTERIYYSDIDQI